MIFRLKNKEYQGTTAIEVVRQMQRDETDFSAEEGISIQQFVDRSLKKLGDRLPPRELAISPRLDDETQAHGYLSLRHDYGIGELIE
ncbi:MAG: hypothetical protein ACR2GD_08065 [Pyrinomonadaceae bacterium]